MRIAALDLGSNSFHLLIARVDGSGALERLISKKEYVRLGSGMVEGGLDTQAMARGLDAVGRLAEIARTVPGTRLVAVGTSALREADNGALFCAEARRRHGVDVEILRGDEEARLAYAGARTGLPKRPGRTLVLDLGGGSAEIAIGDDDRVLFTESVPVGFLRMARRFALGAPLTDLQVTRLAAHVREAMAHAARTAAAHRPDVYLLSGGTARAFDLVAGGGAVHAGPLPAAQVARLATALARGTPANIERLGVDPSRADLLGAAATILATVVQALGAETVSIVQRGLREGLVLREARRVQAAGSAGDAEADAADRHQHLRVAQLSS